MTSDEPRVSRDAFEAALGSRFDVFVEGQQSVPLTLVEVEAGPTTEDWERFSLVFECGSATHLAQGTYDLRHEVIGRLPLFVVPIRSGSSHPQYQAVFNRLTRGSVTDFMERA